VPFPVGFHVQDAFDALDSFMVFSVFQAPYRISLPPRNLYRECAPESRPALRIVARGTGCAQGRPGTGRRQGAERLRRRALPRRAVG
jgi:hypothetical protein